MRSSILALGLGATAVLAQGSKGGEGHAGGSIEDGGDTKVSAMMVRVCCFVLDDVVDHILVFVLDVRR